ncbi:hypothetical protein ACFYO2_09355 [Streptomyces sp. NPDC006602]|uniref:hypothetical protein n=1 Tax=Streptomyces sp. NPDC006602 TaxID=3364751 RepID=UPI0036BB7F05
MDAQDAYRTLDGQFIAFFVVGEVLHHVLRVGEVSPLCDGMRRPGSEEYAAGEKRLDWQLEDPAGLGVEAIRPIRDEIKGLVEGLIKEIAPEPQA